MTTQSAVDNDRQSEYPQPDPGQDRPAALVEVPYRLVIALGIAWILDGLEITIASQRRARPDAAQHAEPGRGPGRRHRLVVPDRRGHRGAVLRPAVRQARPQEPLHDHPRRVPDRQRAHRGDAGRRQLDHLPLRHPGPGGHGDRRRVRRDQLGHRRDDPGEVPGPDRPRGQRHLLGGRAHRHARHPLGAEPRAARLGWRIAFIVGPVLALVIIYVRRNLPESPRWQIMHGRQAEAEASIKEIEDHVEATKGSLPPVDESKELEIRPATQIGYFALLRALFRQYPGRSIAGLHADEHPVVPLQRDLLHLRSGP